MGHLNFKKKKTYRSILGELWEIKIKKKIESGHYTSEIPICRVLDERSNIVFSFAEHLKSQKVNYFCTCSLGRFQQIKTKTLVFEIATYSVLEERCNNIGSFAEHLSDFYEFS